MHVDCLHCSQTAEQSYPTSSSTTHSLYVRKMRQWHDLTVCSLFSFLQSVFGQVVDGGSSGGGGIRVPCSRVGAQALLGLCISIVPHFPHLLLLSILTLVWCVVRVSHCHCHNHIFSPRYTLFLPDLNGYFRSPSPSFCMSVEDSCCTAATGPLLAHSFSVTAVNSQSV